MIFPLSAWLVEQSLRVRRVVIGSQIDQLLPLRSSWDPLKTQLLIQTSSSEGWTHMGHTQQVTHRGHRSLLPLPLPSTRPCRCYALANSKPVDSFRIGEWHTKGSWSPGWVEQERVKMRQRGGDITLSITTQMSYCHGDAKWDKRGKGGEKRRRENEGGKEGGRGFPQWLRRWTKKPPPPQRSPIGLQWQWHNVNQLWRTLRAWVTADVGISTDAAFH